MVEAVGSPQLRYSYPARVRAREAAGRIAWGVFLSGVIGALLGPLVILAAFSFNASTILAFPFEGFTLAWYRRASDDPLLHDALVNSIGLAAAVVPVAVVLGTLSAFGLTRFRFRLRGAIGGLIGAPLVLPWLIIGIALALYFGRLSVSLGLRTVFLAHVVSTFPLVTAIVAARLFRFERAQEEAAIDLGCSRLQVLWYVIFPHIAPALTAAAIFAFTWSFNNVEISLFTIGFEQTFPLWVYTNVRDPMHVPTVNAISTVISLVQLAVISVAIRLLRAGAGAIAPAGVEPGFVS